jgi:peptide/nickel transport system substrate-binding protein
LPQYIPSQYLTGGVAQSWTFNANPLSITITLKQGIMWTGNTNIGMASREITAADCAFAGERYITSATHAPIFTWIKDCVSISQFTYRWDLNSYNANWQFFLLYGGASAIPFSPESVAAGASNWKNAVGTGPFILSDFVDGSSATYTANPGYWGMTTINGKQYQLPFVNKLIYLIIPDQSTELAALASGKIDLCTQIPFTQASTLKQQAPSLIQQKWLSCTVDVLKTNRLASGNPLSNLQVRQALSEATDFNSISNLVYGGGDILGWPVARGNPSYTALTDESAQVQALFSDNITQAQQMLASAGYPKGFTTTITIDSAIAQEADEAQVIANDWAQVGVTVQITTLNTVALAAVKNADSFGGLLDFPVATANPLTPMSWYQGTTLGAIYKTGEPLDVEVNAALAEEDPIKEQADVTQFCKDALLDVGVIPMTNPYNLNCYWPWLKNYYGEVDGGYHNQVVMIREMWVDQNLKSSLR